MVSMTQPMYRSPYEAPMCKFYSITVESVIAASGDNTPGDEEYNDQDF